MGTNRREVTKMIIEIEGITNLEDGRYGIVLIDDEEGTIELEMDSKTFDQLRRAINRAHNRAKRNKA